MVSKKKDLMASYKEAKTSFASKSKIDTQNSMYSKLNSDLDLFEDIKASIASKPSAKGTGRQMSISEREKIKIELEDWKKE